MTTIVLIRKNNELVVSENGVKILGYANMPGRVAETASALFGRNLLNFIMPMVDRDNDGVFKIDWEDEIRVYIEERASYSPDALTGMEANLRFAGPETLETKIFGRLTAWQNWIFQRPNAVGDTGGLQSYGTPTRPEYDYNRT